MKADSATNLQLNFRQGLVESERKQTNNIRQRAPAVANRSSTDLQHRNGDTTGALSGRHTDNDVYKSGHWCDSATYIWLDN